MGAVWVDAQLSPALASWLQTAFGVEAHALRELDLRDAEDQTIFDRARRASAIVVTKDRDFVDLVSNCLENQALAARSAAKSGFQRVAVRTITLRTVSSFRMQATRASFFGLPAATSRV
jgi:hypothetical protein